MCFTFNGEILEVDNLKGSIPWSSISLVMRSSEQLYLQLLIFETALIQPCRVNCWECLTLVFWFLPANRTYLLSRRLSPSLQGSRGGVHLLNSWRLHQCHMWHFQMPAAGAANGSHNGIPTINRLSREMFGFLDALASLRPLLESNWLGDVFEFASITAWDC